MSVKSNDHKYTPIRVAADDPRRCQGKGLQGNPQCNFQALPGSLNCPMHQSRGSRDNTKSIYRFAQTDILARMEEFVEHPESRHLRSELALSRILLERMFDKYSATEFDLIANAGPISAAIAQVNSTLLANTKLEEKLGNLMTVQQVANLAQRMISVILLHVHDEDVQEAIAVGFEEILNNPEKYRDTPMNVLNGQGMPNGHDHFTTFTTIEGATNSPENGGCSPAIVVEANNE